jgi:hypothetical protein
MCPAMPPVGFEPSEFDPTPSAVRTKTCDKHEAAGWACPIAEKESIPRRCPLATEHWVFFSRTHHCQLNSHRQSPCPRLGWMMWEIEAVDARPDT